MSAGLGPRTAEGVTAPAYARFRPSGSIRLPNLSSHLRTHPPPVAAAAPPFSSPASTVNVKAPPSVWLPPRAFQKRSARDQYFGSSLARLSSAASMACFSEAANPMDCDPRCIANTWGRNIDVSVITIQRLAPDLGSDCAMRKDQMPSVEPW